MRNRGGAIVKFLDQLMEGDSVALGFVGFFVVLALVLGLFVLKVRRDLRRDDEAHAKRYGRQPPRSGR
jgi:hypothetical protein